MIKQILVPIDFSDCSINALKYAANLAEKLKVERLIIMHAFTAPVAYSEASTYYSTDTIELEDVEIKVKFEEVKVKVPLLEKIPYEFNLQNSFLLEASASLIKEKQVDLVIMGTKGASGIKGVLFGSNTYLLIKNTNCPVLVVPEGIEYQQLQNIVLAADYKDVEPKTLEPLRILNQLFKTQTHIIHISKNDTLTPEELDISKKYELYFYNIPHQIHNVIDKNVENGLKEYVKTHGIDLITVIPRKHKLYEVIFGLGNSKPIIFHTDIPLLVLPE